MDKGHKEYRFSEILTVVHDLFLEWGWGPRRHQKKRSCSWTLEDDKELAIWRKGWGNIYSRQTGQHSRSPETERFLIFSKTWEKILVPVTGKARGWWGKRRWEWGLRGHVKGFSLSATRNCGPLKSFKQGSHMIRCLVHKDRLLLRKFKQ